MAHHAKHSSAVLIRNGFSIAEIIIALALAMLIVPALVLGAISARDSKVQQSLRMEAVGLAQEAGEAVRSLRSQGWSYISTNGTYHPAISGNQWALAAGSETMDGFTRSMIIADVYRDSAGNIATSGTLDPSTKKITATVSWSTTYPSTISFPYYVTRYENLARIDTTVADFSAGTLTNTVVANNSGGEVVLGAGGRSDWCAPSLTITPLDLPKNGVANAITAIEGKISAGTGDNASGVSFANVTISSTYPPTATLTNSFDGYKTNAVYGETNYAYLATDNNSKEVVIIDRTGNPLTEVGYFNAPGNGSATSVVAVGAVGYAVSNNKLYTFDLSSHSGSRSRLGTATLANTGTKVAVVGSYAYVVNDGTSNQLQIVDVSSSSNPTVVGQASLAGQAGVDVYVSADGSRAYVATAQSASQREFFVVNTSTKTGNQPTIGSYDTSGMNPKGVTVVTGNRAIIVGTGAEEYQVISISTESSPSHCGGLNIDAGVNGVASVLEADGEAYSYIITGDSSSELKIIEGGPGGQSAVSGTYESPVFDALSETAFNRATISTTLPNLTGITYQVSSTDAVSNSCAAAPQVYVGPDGTASTFFSTGATKIPMSNDGVSFENPGRCFRYKVFLTSSDVAATPIFSDFTLNYSP